MRRDRTERSSGAAWGVRLLAASAALTLAAGGCGGGRPQPVPVSGKVTVAGKAPPAGGAVWFTPEEAASGFPMRPGIGDFAADGAYQAKTFAPGDGLLPGRYKLRIDCWKTPPNMEGKPKQSYLPAKYLNPQQSGLELNVQPGADPITFDIDIPKAAQ